MKKSLLLALCALLSFGAVAQNKPLSFNVKAGLNLSDFMGDDTDMSMRAGFKLGAGLEYQFTDMISLRPSLMFASKGASGKEAGVKVSAMPLYLELPVLVGFRFNVANNVNLVVDLGPYFAVGVGGKYKVSAGGTDVRTDFFSDDMGTKRFDMGWVIGVTAEFGKFFAGIDTEFGFINIHDTSVMKNTNFSLGIGVGYKF